jgi:hypothetical protein
MKRSHRLVSRLLTLGLVAGLASAAGGCVVRGGVTYRAHAGYHQPDMVMISPGVYVVTDHDDSVFFHDNYYWRYHNGYWYRSTYHNHGWVAWRNPPSVVVRIDRPNGYVRYRGRPGDARPHTVDHRDGNHGRGPVRVDNRAGIGVNAPDRREDRQDRREDRRENRQDRREDRRENRQDNRDDRREKRQDNRDDRREERQDNRDDRREERQDNRDDRREERQDRRQDRRGGR